MNPKKRHIEVLRAPNYNRRMAQLRVRRLLASIASDRPREFIVSDPIYDQLLPAMELLADAKVVYSWYYAYSAETHSVTVTFSSESLARTPARKSQSITLMLSTLTLSSSWHSR